MRAFPSIADLSYLSPMGDFRAPVSSSVSTFDPTIISGMAAWWAARKESYANNDPVGTATDWSGNGLSLTQSTTSKKPLFLTGQKNGLPAFSADGVDDFLSGGDILDIGTGSIHFFFVAKFDSITGYPTILAKSIAADGSSRYSMLISNSTNWYALLDDFVSNPKDLIGGIADTNWHLFEIILDRPNTRWSLVVDGIEIGSNSTVAAGDMNSTYRLLLFAYSDATDTGEVGFMQGKIAEVWCWKRVLTDNERDTLRIGAADLYNIPVSTSQFQPNDIAGLVIWQDAAQITGLSDGSSVATWSDYSGNGLSLTAPTVSNQPTYKTSIIGAQPALLFDGVDDELVISSHTFNLTAGTLFAVYKATTGNYGVVRVNNDTAGSYWRFVGDGNGYWGIFYTSRIEGYPAAMPGSNVAASIIDVSTPTVKEVFVNGVSKGTRSIGFYTPDRVNMGGVVNVGSPRMTGYVAEWGMYNHALTGTALTTLQRYLSAKYFTPASIPGLQLWLDASQITGLNDGDAVATWTDASGNAQHATQSTASKRPLYKTGILNGKPVVRFDGVDDFLRNDVFTALNNAPAASLFIVKRQTSSGGINFPVLFASLFYQFNLGSGPKYWRTSITEDANTTLDWTTWTYEAQLFDGSQSGNANRLKIRSNGNPVSVSYTGTIAATLSSGTGFYVSTSDGTLYPWNGDIAEIIAYSATPSAGELAQLEQYLAAKYGL